MRYLFFILAALVTGTVIVNAQTDGRDCGAKDPAALKLIEQARRQEETGDLRGAIDTGKKILAIKADNVCELNTIAGLYGKLGEFDQEMIWAKKAIVVDPKFMNAYINLGNAYALSGKVREAAEAFTKAKEIEPKHPLPLYSLGVLHEQQEKFGEALEFYKQSVTVGPQFTNGYFNLAAMYAALRRFSEARAALLKLLNIDPRSDDARDMLRAVERELAREGLKG